MIKKINQTSSHSSKNRTSKNVNNHFTKSSIATNEVISSKINDICSKLSPSSSVEQSQVCSNNEKEINEIGPIANNNDKTNDTTQYFKMLRNGSTGNLFANRLNQSLKVSPCRKIDLNKSKEKLIKDYMTSIAQEHCINRDNLQNEKEELYKNYENNINLLESWIQKIKAKKETMNEKEYQKRKESIAELIEKINSIRVKLAQTKKGISTQEINNSRYQVEISKSRDRVQQNKTNRETIVYDVINIKKKIPTYLPKTEQIKEETKIVNEAIMVEQNEITELNTSIQQINKKISAINREKETILTSIKLLKKQIESCRLKINNSFTKTTSFMLNVNNLVENLDQY